MLLNTMLYLYFVGKLSRSHFLGVGIKNKPFKYFEHRETLIMGREGGGRLATES